jgi:hypothetical protein
MSFETRIPEMNSLNSDLTNNTNSNNIFDSHLQQNKHSFSISSLVNPSYSEITRLRDELANKNVQMVNWEEQITQAKNHCDAYKQEIEEQLRKVCLIRNLKNVYYMQYKI